MNNDFILGAAEDGLILYKYIYLNNKKIQIYNILVD